MMESEVTGNCHASFGERDRETRLLQDLKVRPVPTPYKGHKCLFENNLYQAIGTNALPDVYSHKR